MYYSQAEYWQAALESGMIDIATLRAEMDMTERKKLLTGHKIYQDKKNFWYTRLDNRLVKRTTKEAIEDLIVEYERAKAAEPTVRDVFYMFIDQKLRYGDISKSTYDRYERDYERYIRGREIESVRFRALTENYLEHFIRCTIADLGLTSKAYSNLKTILRGMLLFAKGKYTDISAQAFFGDLQFSKNTFKKKIIKKEEQVFSEEEIPIVTEYLHSKKSIRCLGILLAFRTGIRVGELAAIRKGDIVYEEGTVSIHIQRTETKYRENGVYVTKIKDYPKSSAGDRYVFCTDKTVETIRQIEALNPDVEYLFEENGERLCEFSFSNALDWLCKSCRIPKRSMHKIRKTYGTTLIDAGVDECIITEQMGHSDINCTRQYYYFFTKNRDKKREQIQSAITY